MATHLAAIGLGTSGEQAFRRLIREANQAAQRQEMVRGVRVQRWEDASGAAVVLGWRGNQLLSFMPAFASRSGIRLANCHPVRAPVAVADVLDGDGTQVTALAAEVEQYLHLAAARRPADGSARITAFGLNVRVHEDEDAFRAAPKGPDDATDAADFVPFGAFAEPAKAQPHARLTGTVVRAERRVCHLTGDPFIVAITRTAGFDADVCLAGGEHPEVPAPGAIISGVVSLSVSLDHPPACDPSGP